ILSTYDVINAEELYEYVRRIGEKISMLELEYAKLSDVLRRLCDICEKAKNIDANIMNEVSKALKQIDIRFSREQAINIDKIVKELEKLYNNVSGKVSSKLAKIYRQAEALRRLVRAICVAGIYDGDICSIDLSNVENIVSIRDKIIQELRKVLRDYVDDAIRIAEIGDEVSLEDLDERGKAVLERLCELGVVRRVYRFLS
ncbi:MAG: hypothetical protein GXO26_06565, partial [Crenarchaeota archaeon]|nr:hypothetical protein [Thermoproteota archaeon]